MSENQNGGKQYAKCPYCGKNVKVVGRYKNGTPELAGHSRDGWKNQSCDSFVTRKQLGLSELPMG